MKLRPNDYTTISYKIFLIIMILSQAHLILCHVNELHLVGEIISCALLVYLVFRFYLLNKLSVEAQHLSLTLHQFLQKDKKQCDDCKKNCDKC